MYYYAYFTTKKLKLQESKQYASDTTTGIWQWGRGGWMEVEFKP